MCAIPQLARHPVVKQSCHVIHDTFLGVFYFSRFFLCLTVLRFFCGFKKACISKLPDIIFRASVGIRFLHRFPCPNTFHEQIPQSRTITTLKCFIIFHLLALSRYSVTFLTNPVFSSPVCLSDLLSYCVGSSGNGECWPVSWRTVKPHIQVVLSSTAPCSKNLPSTALTLNW